MAKKKQAVPRPLKGIYRKQRRKLSADQWRAWCDALNAPAESFVEKLRQHFVAAAEPYLVALSDSPTSVLSGETPPPDGCTRRVVVLAPGELYAARVNAPAELDFAVEGARLCENLVRAIQRNDTGAIIQNAVAIGREIERLAILPLEPLVVEGHKRKVVMPAMMRARKAGVVRDLRADAEEAIRQARLNYDRRCDDTDFIKEKAAQSLGITKRALNLRLQKKS